MAAPKVLTLVNGRPTEAYASAIGGTGNGEKLVSTNTAGTLDPTYFPAGIGQDIVTVPATEALAAGNLVNLYAASGTESARKADASTVGKEANGFVLSAVPNGGTAAVYRSGQNTAVTGLTPGEAFLSATVPGGIQSTPPTGSGQTVQKVGKVITSTLLDVQPGQDFALA